MICGMFDMRNFGDLLFPLIAEHELGLHGYNVQAVSPTGAATGLSDAMPSRPIAQLFDPDLPCAAVVIGGGYLVHTHRMDMLHEYRGLGVGACAASSMWLGATLAAALRDVPLAWNAPGVPHPLRPSFQPLAGAAFDAADYLSLRDQGSVRMAGLVAGGPVQVVPDPVLGLARMWPKASLRGDFDRLAQRLGLTTREGILAVSVRRRSLGDVPVAAFAQELGARCKALNLTPVMIGLGSAHSDDRIAREVSAALTAMGCPNAALDQPEQLRDIAALIAYASAYAGSSLHGYVAAAAYGTPGLLVARPAYRKFDGLVQHLDRDADKVNDWSQALGRLSDAVCQPRTTLSSAVQNALTQHWNQIVAAIEGGATPRRAARLRFAALSMGEGMRQENAVWAMLPYTSARDRAAALSGEDVAHKEPF